MGAIRRLAGRMSRPGLCRRRATMWATVYGAAVDRPPSESTTDRSAADHGRSD